MSVAAEVNERLAKITELGTSIWLDQIRLNLIESGELERLVKFESLRGVTSNPAIFEKAILGSDDYDELIEEAAKEGLDGRAIYERVAVKTVQDACDVLRPVWDEAQGADGFVSIEVEPDLAFDTDKTIESARHYWEAVDRPNVMIKIPGTDEGTPAIEQMIYEGVNVNVTLLFSVEAYSRVAEAYIKGLERRKDEGKDMGPQSVASFFVSRVDTEVDKRLDEKGNTELQGTAAVANARAAYMRFKEIFSGERWQALADAGARVQRPLWASTGTKNPAYPETKYVDTLVGPDTVNTMPSATLAAAGEQSEVDQATVDQDPTAELDALREAGIDMDDVTAKLLQDGVDAFITPFEKLLAGIESAREAVELGRPKSFDSSIPDELEEPLRKRLEQAQKEDVARRVWHKDESLWGGPGVPEIGNRLGWLTIAQRMLDHCGSLTTFADEVRADGMQSVVLCGMGGSSLAPEVLRQSFERGGGGLDLHVLDSTDPGAIKEVEDKLDLERTLFLISSKSGGTVETLSQYRYFRSKIDNGRNFVAITDPGSSLEELGKSAGFRRVFLNDPDIGGRYSALSYFGLVPAALMGIDVKALLDRARIAEENCSQFDASTANSGLWLGVAMGELALHGKDKLTFVVDEPIASFGLWVEQLIAESTGKHGKGVLPVADEPLGTPDMYGDDRVLVHLKSEDGADLSNFVAAGMPVLTLHAEGPGDLGRIFFFAEFATAVTGWVLGINAFDQPNVQEAKDATAKVLEEGLEEPESGKLDLSGVAPPNYVAIQGFVKPSDEFDEAIVDLRSAIRDKTKATTTFGYGPRYLHSTGQFHKGGPATGVFIQLVHDGDEDIEIPEAGYTFKTLKNAQALGDYRTLQAHNLPVTRIRLEGDPVQAVRDLIKEID
ncbi:MAG: transaldolase / glucose-6-phosphate isomerase [Thermoleophilaceae bacterium]|nr:transaldolase / glucose-6-phosphate isomerase [Thermoleophilaceae bacterium]